MEGKREGQWTPIQAKEQDTRANPNSWETHLVRKRWDIGLLRALSPRIMMMMMMMSDFAFLVDLTGYLNNLNLKLQQSSKLLTTLCNDVASFKMKLWQFVNQLSETFTHKNCNIIVCSYSKVKCQAAFFPPCICLGAY